jgi:glycosyltransferase involved in cell wall biosynthesis
VPRFVGVKNGSIRIISNAFFVNDDLTVVELPAELDEVTSQELMLHYHLKNNKIESKTAVKAINDLKVAFINNWKMKCGISTYSEFLIPEISKKLSDFKLFVEYNDAPTSDMNAIGNIAGMTGQVQECWKRGEPLDELIQAIEEYEPDVILIQHEFGLFPNARYWLSFMSRLAKFRIIVTMHSVFYHQDKTVVEACMREIVVHVNGAKEVLKSHKEVAAKVYLIPHGCFINDGTPTLWNCYKSDHTFVTQGFSFRYKRFENCIRAAAILKGKYPDVFFTGLLAESPFNEIEHQIYYEELVQLSKDLKVESNISLIRGYQSETVIDSFLRTNKIAVFPYGSDPKHLVYGASGACRVAMAKGIPVITSSIPHFQDLPSIKADTPEEIARELDVLFSSKEAQNNQVSKQNTHLIENSWEMVADSYLKLFST